jgi:E3 ubiquitin-protein ligase HUWE1
LQGKGPKLILDLPASCFLPEHEPYISAIMRHILEDPATLQVAMEAEIRNTLTKGRTGNRTDPFSRGALLAGMRTTP